MAYFLLADGASKSNPGPASVGAVCFEAEQPSGLPSLAQFESGEVKAVFQVSEAIGKATNNEAEYLALIKGLEKASAQGIGPLSILLDSLLVVEQIKGNYKVKKEHLKPLWARAKELLQSVEYTIGHVKRDKNQIADYLANLALQSNPKS